jgi:hypothetical protein
MIMMQSANKTNNLINSSSCVVDTLRMCKHFNKSYCRNSSLQKLLNSQQLFSLRPLHRYEQVLCTVSPLGSYLFRSD